MTVNNIHSYIVFANIDKGDKIEGHRLILTKEQLEKIEDIVLSEKIKVIENPFYVVEDE